MNKPFDFKNLRVLNTRPKNQATTTSQNILRAGGIPIELPLLEIKATDASWTHSLPKLETIQHAIFISPNAVTYFFEQLTSTHWPKTITTYALGMGTQRTLEKHHIINPVVPKIADSEHLLMLESLQEVTHQSILLIKGEAGRTLIFDTLSRRNATITPIEVYQRCLPQYNQTNVNALFHEDAVDIILITSETALRHLFILFDEKAKDWLCTKPCLVISERLAKTARNLGFKTVITRSAGI